MLNHLLFLIVGAALLCPLQVLAEDFGSPDLLITKSFKQSLAESIGTVTTITKEQIAETSATSVVDLLKTVPGISTYRKGGDSSLSQIRIRGFEDEQVLIYVDGVIVNDVYFGTHRLEFIDIGNIDQIEIAQGASALAYGAGASAGVISITTTPGSISNNEISGSLLVGNNTTQQESANLNHKISEKTAFTLSANHYKTEGYDVRRDTDPDIDGSEKSSFSTAILTEVSRTQIKIAHSEQDGSLMIDGDTSSQNDIDHLVKSSSIKLNSASDRFKFELTHGISEVDEIAYERENSVNRNVYQTHSNNSAIFLSSTDDESNISYTIGLDHSRGEREATFGQFGPYYNYAENTGVILSQEMPAAIFGANKIATTLRHDDNKDWGNHTSIVAVSHFDGASSNTLVSASSSFRPPTFADYAAERGERTNQVQIDHSRIWGDTIIDLSITKARTPNKMLQGNSTGGQPGGENRINFAEMTFNTYFWNSDLKLSYAYTDSRLKEKNWTRMPFVSDHVIHISSGFQTHYGYTNIQAVSQSGFFTDYFEPKNSHQSGFTDINLSHVKKFSDSLRVKLALENLLDRSVTYDFSGTTQQRFQLPGRSFMVSLSGKF